MLKKILGCLLLIFIWLQLNATTYYVSSIGSDTNSGSSLFPWKSLSYACSIAQISGDIIHIKAGTIYNYDIAYLQVGVSLEGEGVNSIVISSLPDQPIVLLESYVMTAGNQSISNIKFDGGGIAHSAITINQRSKIKISNCFFSNFKIYPEYMWNTYAIEGNQIENVEIFNNTVQGMIFLFHNKNVDIHHNTIGYPTMNVDYRDGIYACDVDSFAVRNNYFKNLAMQIDISSYLDTKVRDVFIYNNVMFNIGVASSEWYGSGIDFGGSTTFPAQNILIANNTMIANPQDRNTRIGIYLPCIGYATDVYIENNIMEGFRYATIFAAGPEPVIDVIVIKNNIFWDNTTDTTKTYCTSDSAYYTNIALPLNQTYVNNFFVNPSLVSATDFHITESSPAFGAGINIPAVKYDYENNVRGSTYDIGAYMYVVSTNVEDPKKAMNILVYPVPFSDHFTVVVDEPEFISATIEISNMIGQVVYKDKLTSTISNITLKNTLSGFYLIKITSLSGNIAVMKVIQYR